MALAGSCSVKIGIIGGTGLDDPDILQGREEKSVKTPFGEPSDALVTGEIGGVPCVLLARHGRKHHLMPSHVNYRANIWALKEEGCTHIIVTTACGSLKEEIAPGDLVFLDQFIDHTYKRESTFYDSMPDSPAGICHMQMVEPFCKHTRDVFIRAAKKLQLRYHEKGTAITIEGPRFSSKAESNLFRSWGGDVVNMTTVPEVCLAKELGICYGSIALPTDYDCWKGEPVNVELVVRTMKQNGERATKLILAAVPMLAAEDWNERISDAQKLVKTAVMLP